MQKNIGNNKFHVSSERNESLSQEIKYGVYFDDESNYCYCSCGSFRKERVVCKHFFAVIRKGLKCFNDITHLYRFHPFTILDDDLFNIPNEMNEEVVHMTSDYISPKNDLEDSNPTDSFNELQNQEVVSVLLPQRESTFKLKKMNLLANIKVVPEKCYNLKSSENIIGEPDAGINQLTRIVDAELCRQQQNDSLVERPKTPKKRKSKTNFKALPNKRKKHPYSERVGTKADMMKQSYKAKISLSQMMQISNGNYKTLLVNNKEDDVTEIIITNNKNDVDKSPRRFVTRPKSLKTIFLQIENNEELRHDTINLCQSILKEQSNMAGFEDTGLTWHQFSHSPGKFVQILFLSDRNHWIVIARGPGGDEVHIYDSLNSYGQEYLRETSKAICQKTYCSSGTLRIINMPVQHQPNNVDCRVFAVAFAADCVFHIKSETATYKTDVMRTHLKECLTQKKFEPFPKITKRSNRCKSYITYMDVFCICRWEFDDSDPEKDKGLFMACCSVCEEWFHQKCVKINREVFLDEKVYKRWKCH